jgi:hypothetical protein
MSELKVYHHELRHNEYEEFYLKYEADKVIAEKDAEIVELKKQVLDYAQGLYVIQARADKDARHHKYKRCLAMAYVEWLKQMSLCNYPDSILYRRAARRERKWKKIAEKFKPNKEAK